MKKYCPLIGGPCEDGHPKEEDMLFCVNWDTLNQYCAFAQQSINVCEAIRKAQQNEDKKEINEF